MSIAARLSIPDKARRKSCHRRTDSGELDVFEAERYFSSGTESLPQKIGTMSTRREEYHANPRQFGRTSLDMPKIMRHSQHTLSQPQTIVFDSVKPSNEKKKHKQPSSPGGKLASFFTSLINQTVSKKKKSASQVKDVIIEDDNSPGGWRRRRRNSITTFSTTTTTSATRNTKITTMSEIDSKSIKSSSSFVSGFRTPPPYVINMPIKPYKEFKSGFSRNTANPKLDEKPKIIKHSSSKEFKRFMDEDGAESDSSSDLFELQLNSDHHRRHHHQQQMGFCSSDLPVYDSTHMDTIKISTGTPIINGPLRK